MFKVMFVNKQGKYEGPNHKLKLKTGNTIVKLIIWPTTIM